MLVDMRLLFRCHELRSVRETVLRVMPNYLLNYGPILFVMIVNPIIYVQCSREVDRQLIIRYGQYTNNERQIHDLFKIKFSLINLIFYICWLPNVLNAILMWTMWSELSRRNTIGVVVVINWYIIAIFNPLQAFFNALVYRKWNDQLVGCCSIKDWIVRKFKRQQNGTYTTQIITESTPLLQQTLIMASDDEIEQEDELEESRDQNFHRYSIQCNLV
jgi:ocular albinism type 1 protein